MTASKRAYPRFLLYSEYNNLWQVKLNDNATAATSLRIPLTEYIYSPAALDYNYLDEKVYWADASLNTISRALLDGSSQETIVSTRLQNPYGLAVDPFGQNVYWTNTFEKVIEVASLDGLYRRVLIRDDLLYPSEIVLDVTRGYD
ncbi:Low-density lipoprotein receptor- protein 6 [Desmophyllum pertusum]|uniref:Low-density lipoprotein receptor- protein 6 n=1 Tax=Desmophyllum pertusum TaxID=174260 RepID=A0A9W9YP23_9CNID|nr:Low-density lipoprotein receptor- protein 6 [Desmophyllum pertusum]